MAIILGTLRSIYTVIPYGRGGREKPTTHPTRRTIVQPHLPWPLHITATCLLSVTGLYRFLSFIGIYSL